jgi:hypothetical protein
MSENIDLLIREKEKELSPFYSRMEELRLEFVNYTIIFTAKWYNETAKQHVTKHTETTLNLNKEKLFQMKAQVNILIQNTEKTVKVALSDPNVWWHMKPIKHVPSSLYDKLGNEQVGNKFPAIVDRAVRRALGKLGSVLEAFGYRVTTAGALGGYYAEFWFEYPEGPDSSPHPFFPHLLEWSEDMQYVLQKYSGQFRKAIVLFNDLEKLKDEKEKLKASELWDSV